VVAADLVGSMIALTGVAVGFQGAGFWNALLLFVMFSVAAYWMVRWAIWMVKEQKKVGFSTEGGAVLFMWALWLLAALLVFWFWFYGGTR
jgi:hypothetical protein